MLQEKSCDFRDFFSLDNLFSDQSRHIIPTSSKFFEKMFVFSYFIVKDKYIFI